MADIFCKQKRSEIMRCVRSSKNKSTELRLIKLFRTNKIFGWRRNYKLKGKPDFVFLNEKIAVFTDGCFWHGHGCRNISPVNNRKYWKNKIMTNKVRDKLITKYLRSIGWKVIRIWECELTEQKQHQIIGKIDKYLIEKRVKI